MVVQIAAHREWYQNNRDVECHKNRERARIRYKRDSDILKSRVYDWRKENKDKVNDIAQRRRCRKKNQVGFVPTNITDILWNLQEGLCFYCKQNLKLTGFHRDHMISLSKGGLHDQENLCLACPSCNLRKNNKTAEEFLAKI